jgi:hypothetical protein
MGFGHLQTICLGTAAAATDLARWPMLATPCAAAIMRPSHSSASRITLRE